MSIIYLINKRTVTRMAVTLLVIMIGMLVQGFAFWLRHISLLP